MDINEKNLEQVTGGRSVNIYFFWDDLLRYFWKCRTEAEEICPDAIPYVDQCLKCLRIKSLPTLDDELSKLKKQFPECSYYADIDALIAEY